MQFPNSSREEHFSTFEKYYSMEDTKLDLMFTNTELGDRVYVDYSSVNLDTPPELLNLCKIVQAMMVVPSLKWWYMLEHAVLSPRGELYLRYSVHDSLSEPYHSLPVYANPLSPAWAYRKFAIPIDIKNAESLELCAETLQAMASTEGSLSQLETYLEPASRHTMVAVHATGQANAAYLHPAHTMDLAAECVERGMWSLVKILSNGVDVEDNTHYEVACTIWYYCPGYGLVSEVETDKETKKTYYREIIRWVEEDPEVEADE
ncbi:hypothetical protein EV421DRAFT_1820861 [Armillaria borealis]|uniref:Uncharacterized protein n=1 Tax=Armillaria borealis TaxID=47425 RepID=A0AA39MLM6_9AGAR|nr:hypothetical protein EV421DRAFT_1820861 [Armillaria borealis]